MHCSHCGAILFGESAYCSNCGTLIEPQPVPEGANLEPDAETLRQTSAPPMNTLLTSAALSSGKPAGPSPEALLLPVKPVQTASSAGPSIESGWAEFSTMQVPSHAGASTPSGAYPPLPVPAAYAPTYMVPGAYPGYVSNLMPPGVTYPAIMQAPQRPRRRWPLFVLGMIVGMLITLVFGGVIVGLRAGQASNSPNGATTIAASTPTSVATSIVDANLLYQQITSQAPTFVDSLQDAATSRWVTVDKPTYGCKIENDGLHIHIADTNKFYYCTSGRGNFANFAFQVEMKILTGNGGGIVFRSDSNAGNEYYFHVYPDGSYEVNSEQNHKFGTVLVEGTASSAPINGGIKSILAVIAQGSNIYLYFNKKLIKKFQDSAYASGYMGVAADDHGTPADVVYTNAQIWRL